MSKNVVVLAFSFALVFALIVTSAVAQVRTVGVSVGDSFMLGEVVVNWSSNDTSATFPPHG